MNTSPTPRAGSKAQESAQHTPGPWIADKWAPGYTVSAPDSHYSVCHLEGCNNAEANARLIAAAPALLAALKAIAEGCSFPEDDVQRACRDRARAAIAQAEARP